MSEDGVLEQSDYLAPAASIKDAFGTLQVKIVLLENFMADPLGMLRAACDFLGEDPSKAKFATRLA